MQEDTSNIESNHLDKIIFPALVTTCFKSGVQWLKASAMIQVFTGV